MKKIILVHGWGGTPDNGWFPWLRRKLEEKGFEVVVPQLPGTDRPHISTWVPALASTVGVSDKDTYFVGHSMGCQTIVRYLETLSEDQEVGGAIFVAGFFKPLKGLETDDESRIDREWAETDINFDKVRQGLKKSVALFSDNDPYVPVANADIFKEKLGSEIIIQKNQNHFNEGSGFTELPIVLEKLLEIIN